MAVAKTWQLPYYAVIFTSVHSGKDKSGYNKMAARMNELAAQQPGYLGFESAREETGISVSYWENLEAIKNWKEHGEHILAQQKGKDVWYHSYHVRICRVESEYGL